VGKLKQTPCVISIHPEPRPEMAEKYHAVLSDAVKEFNHQRATYPDCKIVHYDSLADAVSNVAKTNKEDFMSLTGKPTEICKYAKQHFKKRLTSWHDVFLDTLFPPTGRGENKFSSRGVAIGTMTKKELMHEFIDYTSLVNRNYELFNANLSNRISTPLVNIARKTNLDIDELLLRAFNKHFHESVSPYSIISPKTGLANLKHVITKFEDSSNKELSKMASYLKEAADKNNIELPQN
jgi:hypothetical protein